MGIVSFFWLILSYFCFLLAARSPESATGYKAPLSFMPGCFEVF
jgi:hypothetical protein